jgi:hypothetical protein
VTPPRGSPLDCGFDPPVDTVEHPLLAKGIIIEDGANRYVLCAVDWCGLCNSAHDLVRARIADAAGTRSERVALHAVHQHTAPVADVEAQQILAAIDGAPPTTDLGFLDQAAEGICAAVRQAQPVPVTHVGTSWAPVDRVASSRRILQPDGTILKRSSSTTEPLEIAAAEGLIDGFVRTVTLLNGGSLVAQLHYYACHPQTFYRDGRVSYDTAGIARERLQQETGVLQVYFNGCGGEIAMSKYNDGSFEARAQLAQRLYDGLAQAARAPEIAPIDALRWQVRSFDLTPRQASEFGDATCRRTLADASEPAANRVKAAMILAFRERVRAGCRYEVSALTIGSARILHLPGEPFVEYQLYAQRMCGDHFVAVAGYGDCAMWYIPTDQAFRERGGYETTWAFAEPCEAVLKQSISELAVASLQ